MGLSVGVCVAGARDGLKLIHLGRLTGTEVYTSMVSTALLCKTAQRANGGVIPLSHQSSVILLSVLRRLKGDTTVTSVTAALLCLPYRE
jgi:hypothetical protein